MRRVAALASIVPLYLALSIVVFDQIEEDAFIYFRIAGNLAEGHGYVFNAGGERIEAGSSYLWQVLLGWLHPLPLDSVLTAKLAGCGFGVVALLLTSRLARSFVEDGVLQLVPPLLLAVSAPFLMHSQRGLETLLYTVVVLTLGLCFMEPRLYRFAIVPAVLMLAARPEGFFTLAGVLPAAAYARRREGRVLLLWGAAVVVAAAILLTLRWVYFQDLLPHPFYIKMRPGGGLGWAQVQRFLWDHRIFLFAAPLLLMAGRRAFWSDQRIVVAAFVATHFLWCVLAKDNMPHHRQLVPALPFLYVLIVSALDGLAGRGSQLRRRVALAWGGAFVVSTLLLARTIGYHGSSQPNPVRPRLAALLADPLGYLSATLDKIADPYEPNPLDRLSDVPIGTNYQSRVGRFLRDNYPPGIRIAYDQMGQTPYYAGSDKHFIDTWGLVDRTIGHAYFRQREDASFAFRAYSGLVVARLLRGGDSEASAAYSMPHLLDYVFDAQPDLILINSFSARAALLPAWILHDPRLAADYEPTYQLAGLVRIFERKPRADRTPVVPDGLEVTELDRASAEPGRGSGDEGTSR